MDPKVCAAVLIATMVLAGCAAAPREPSGTTTIPASTPATSSSSSTPTEDPPTPTRSPLNLTLLHSGCKGILGSGEVPRKNVAPLVPQAFNIVGFSPESVGLQFHGIACQRTVAGTTIKNDTLSFWLAVEVSPKNRSWDFKGLDWYVLDLHSAGFAIPLNLTGHTEGKFSFSNVSGMARWSVRNGSLATYEFEAPLTQADVSAVVTQQLWFGPASGPFVRMPQTSRYNIDTASPVAGEIRSSGSSRSATVVGPSLPLLTGSQHNGEIGWELNEANIYEA